ncbi:MAG: type II toxin-antitoxin system VapC family toxin [Anaerolineaceae bacterium]|nr:MAG: type II toxin-antitoxin system VapC family toxin [Anaerolineaceae bacterium]
MKYLLDTNTCIRYINGRSPQIRAKLPTIPLTDVGVSIITKAELFYGSAKSQTPEQSRQKQLEFLRTVQTIMFDESAAIVYGEIRAHLDKQGTPIGANDLLIAATAKAGGFIVVTHNIREFGRVPGLKIEDWEA